MKITVGELRWLIHEAAESNAYFHLSEKDLGPSTVLTPRVPRHPLEFRGMPIEDWFTPRVSFAASIETALDGLQTLSQVYHVYTADELPGMVEPAKVRCPSHFSKKIGQFDVFKYINKHFPAYFELYVTSSKRWTQRQHNVDIARAKADPAVQTLFRHCVPDARDSGEVWATESTSVQKIGMVKRKNGWKLEPTKG